MIYGLRFSQNELKKLLILIEKSEKDKSIIDEILKNHYFVHFYKLVNGNIVKFFLINIQYILDIAFIDNYCDPILRENCFFMVSNPPGEITDHFPHVLNFLTDLLGKNMDNNSITERVTKACKSLFDVCYYPFFKKHLFEVLFSSIDNAFVFDLLLLIVRNKNIRYEHLFSLVSDSFDILIRKACDGSVNSIHLLNKATSKCRNIESIIDKIMCEDFIVHIFSLGLSSDSDNGIVYFDFVESVLNLFEDIYQQIHKSLVTRLFNFVDDVSFYCCSDNIFTPAKEKLIDIMLNLHKNIKEFRKKAHEAFFRIFHFLIELCFVNMDQVSLILLTNTLFNIIVTKENALNYDFLQLVTRIMEARESFPDNINEKLIDLMYIICERVNSLFIVNKRIQKPDNWDYFLTYFVIEYRHSRRNNVYSESDSEEYY